MFFYRARKQTIIKLLGKIDVKDSNASDNMVQVKNKVILISGSNSGLGLATVKRLAAADAKAIIAVDRNIDNLQILGFTNVKAYQLDMTDWEGVEILFSHIVKEYGRLDILINNAGLFEPPGANYWFDEDVKSYATIEVNLNSLLKATRLAIKAFMAQPPPIDGSPAGVIVNTSSVGGQVPTFAAPLYAASKWGINFILFK